jgi:hypothetical protein
MPGVALSSLRVTSDFDAFWYTGGGRLGWLPTPR